MVDFEMVDISCHKKGWPENAKFCNLKFRIE